MDWSRLRDPSTYMVLLLLAIASLIIAQVPQGQGLDFLTVLFACTALLAGG